MDNQHRKITGYRELTQRDIDVMNKIKAKGAELDALVQEVQAIPEVDQRWASIAKTDLQTGLMALTCAVAKPTSF